MKKIYQMTLQERIEYIKNKYQLDSRFTQYLSEDVIDTMVENSVGSYEIPMGVVEDFTVNDKQYLIPMVTEEPSVIAALNKGSKVVNKYGSIVATTLNKSTKGQIAFLNPRDTNFLLDSINKDELMELSKIIYPSIYNRGGGVQNIEILEIYKDGHELVIVEVEVDTKDAMGANMVNTLCEGIKLYLEEKSSETATMAILTNASEYALVEATLTLDLSTMIDGDEIGQAIQNASIFSQLDPHRAVTHNKGIMNGIEALVQATGNDTRAVSAAVHMYAGISGIYTPLSKWTYTNNILKGYIIIPMPIGIVGGSINVHPKASQNIDVLQLKDARELMELIASVGLVQNFSALYALVTDGIQKGHMALQLKNLALSLGASSEEITQIQKEFKGKKFDRETLRNSLQIIRDNKKSLK